jgi:tripartite ATP-independent transporter DctP family solute receptor
MEARAISLLFWISVFRTAGFTGKNIIWRKKMLKKSLIILSVLVMGVSLMACRPRSQGSTAVSTNAADPFVDGPSYAWKLGHVQITTHPYHIGAEAFASKLSELTKDKVKIEIYPSSQLGGEIAMTEAVQMGNLEFAITSTAVLANFNASFTVFDFPFLFENRQHAYTVLDENYGQSKMEILKNFGMVGLAWYENGFFDIMNGKRPITKISDLQGLNIRIMQNPVYIAAFSAMGANPVPMAPAEVYTALQNGTVDGNCLSINGIYGFRFYEVQTTYMLADMFFCALPFVMSKQLYDSLPPAYQQAILEAGKYSQAIERQASVDQEEVNLATMMKSGITTTKPDNRNEWVQLMETGVYPQFADKVSTQELQTIKGYAN